MSAFFTSLLCAAIAGGIGTALTGKEYEKHVRYLAALLCTALIVSPIISLIPKLNISAPEQYSGIEVDSTAAHKLVEKQTVADAETAAADYIFLQTGIKVKSLSIQIKSKEQTLHVTAVTAAVNNQDEVQRVGECLAALFGNQIPIKVAVDD